MNPTELKALLDSTQILSNLNISSELITLSIFGSIIVGLSLLTIHYYFPKNPTKEDEDWVKLPVFEKSVFGFLVGMTTILMAFILTAILEQLVVMLFRGPLPSMPESSFAVFLCLIFGCFMFVSLFLSKSKGLDFVRDYIQASGVVLSILLVVFLLLLPLFLFRLTG